MCYSSRRPHRVLLLSDKNRKRRLQFAQAHQNWTTEDWKNVAWPDESWFLLHSDGKFRIWRKEHESMDPSCLVSTVQAGGGGVMVRGILLLTMSIPLWLQCTHLLMASSSSILHHVAKLKSSQTGFLNMTMCSLYSNGLHSHQISIK